MSHGVWQGGGPPPLQPEAYGYPSPPPRRTGLMIGILAGIGVAVMLCCGGLGGLGWFAYSASIDQAKEPVTSFLIAVRQDNFEQAWQQMCSSERRSFTAPELESRWDSRGAVSDWQLDDPETDPSTNDLLVPAFIEFTDGHRDTIRFVIRQEGSTAQPRVCGER